MNILAALFVVLLSAPVFAQSQWENFQFEGGRGANSVNTIAEDNYGKIWIGTSEKLHWFDGIEWQSLEEILGKSEYSVRDIAIEPNNDLWVIMNNWGILKYSNGTWSMIKEGIFGVIEFDSHGNLWTSTSPDATLARYDGQTWKKYSYSSDMWIYYVYDIATNDSGDIWVGTGNGLYHTHADSLDSWTVYTEEDGLIDEDIHDIDFGPNGDIWAFSNTMGISYFNQGMWRPITHDEDEFDPWIIENIEVDNYGTLWCRQLECGLCAYINNTWIANALEPTVAFSHSFNDMFIDSQDRIWIGNDKGLFCHQLEPTVVGVQEEEPEPFTLSPPTPNPFNPTTRISYTLAESSPVTLVVYNVSGQKVATLVDEQQAAGMHTATFDGTGLASGLYFARITTGGVVRTEKMVLMK